MSPLELSLNQKCGFTRDKILYVCNNIDAEEMKLVHDAGVLICLDSISQVEIWGQNFPNTDIMIRVNPGIQGVGHNDKVITSGKSTKFGITEKSFRELFKIIKKYNLNIIGIHQHLGSLFLNDKIQDYINGVRRGLDIILNNFENIKIIDLGGGFGVPYKDESDLNFETLQEALINELKDFTNKYKSVREFKFEPGRYIPCEAGFLIGKINAVKYENDTYWIGTDIGMNQLVRPSMYEAYHKIELIENRQSELIKANVCGNICESGDILAKDRSINKPNIGDEILVYNAGAYGYSMASNYTGRLRPAEVMFNAENNWLIRKRETIEDLEKNIIW
jgi:diaminopimelate decarboxylase